MSRLPSVHREDVSGPGRVVWDAIATSRGPEAVTPQGTLGGPYNAWIQAPDVGAAIVEMGAALRFRASVPQRLVELAIITVGAHWKAEFEWYAHTRLARQEGISDDVIDAIARGEQPTFKADDEAMVHKVAAELMDNGHLGDVTYQEAHELLGNQGMVEIISLCGFYTLVSFTLNGFAVPLPEGISPTWA
jgi:4-carboxymuconolactone decarboxylase